MGWGGGGMRGGEKIEEEGDSKREEHIKRVEKKEKKEVGGKVG